MIIQVDDSIRRLEELLFSSKENATGTLEHLEDSGTCLKCEANRVGLAAGGIDSPRYTRVSTKEHSPLMVIQKVYYNLRQRRNWTPSSEESMIHVIDQVAQDRRAIGVLCERYLEPAQAISARLLRFHLDHEWKVFSGPLKSSPAALGTVDPTAFRDTEKSIEQFLNDPSVRSKFPFDGTFSPFDTFVDSPFTLSALYIIPWAIFGGAIGWGVSGAMAVYQTGLGKFPLYYGLLPSIFAAGSMKEEKPSVRTGIMLSVATLTGAMWSGMVAGVYQGSDLVFKGFTNSYQMPGILLGAGVGMGASLIGSYISRQNLTKRADEAWVSFDCENIHKGRRPFDLGSINYILMPRYKLTGEPYFPKNFLRGGGK